MEDRDHAGPRPKGGRSDAALRQESEPAKEDIEEGMDRMMNEGGGVVDHYHEHVPVLRNDLVDVDEDPGAK